MYTIKSGNGSGKNGNLKFSGNIDGSAGVTFFLADNKSNSRPTTQQWQLVLEGSGDRHHARPSHLRNFEPRFNSWNTTFCTTDHQALGRHRLFAERQPDLENPDWSNFEVSIAVNQLMVKGWDDINWQPYAWTPFKATRRRAYGDEPSVETTKPPPRPHLPQGVI